MKVIVPWLVLGAVATALIGCGNNLNAPQNFWNVSLTSSSTQTQSLNFSFFANINGTSMTGSGVSFLTATPCFGNSTSPSGVTITGQVTPTNTPGQSTITVSMTWADTSVANSPTNTLSLQGEISNGFGTTTGQGTYSLFPGPTKNCNSPDNGTFFLQTSIP